MTTVGTCLRCKDIFPAACLPHSVEILDGGTGRVCDNCMRVLKNQETSAKTLDRVKSIAQKRPSELVQE